MVLILLEVNGWNMFRLTIDNAKDYIGKTCLVVSRDKDFSCLIEDTIVRVDEVIHLEHCRCRDMVYILNMNEICGPLQKDRVKVGDTGVFFNIINDLSLLSTYKIDTVCFINDYNFNDWPYVSSDTKSYRYFLPMEELPDGLHNL